MRYLTLAFFLTLIMGFAGCADSGNGGDADAGNGAMEEMGAEESAAMDEGSDDTPAWQVLEQNVVHSE